MDLPEIPQGHSGDYLAVFLLGFEVYHAISHACVLFRMRLLPKRDLVRLRWYFLVDLLTVTASAMYTGRFLWLAALQNLQHVFFFITWNTGNYCIKVIDWSSLDWLFPQKQTSSADKSEGVKPSVLDVGLGTAFDMVTHIVYAYLLTTYISQWQMLLALIIPAVLTKLVLFNGRFAWATPGSVPDWVRRRVGGAQPKAA